jgi:hypothetical protein
MAESFDKLISTFASTKKNLLNAQEAARIAHDKLLDACISERRLEILRLDETALKRYLGIQNWQRFPDS